MAHQRLAEAGRQLIRCYIKDRPVPPRSVRLDGRHKTELGASGGKAINSLINICVWAKTSAGIRFYRFQHEFEFVFKVGSEQHRNTVQPSKFARNRSNV